jgi:hypothetical protein
MPKYRSAGCVGSLQDLVGPAAQIQTPITQRRVCRLLLLFEFPISSSSHPQWNSLCAIPKFVRLSWRECEACSLRYLTPVLSLAVACSESLITALAKPLLSADPYARDYMLTVVLLPLWHNPNNLSSRSRPTDNREHWATWFTDRAVPLDQIPAEAIDRLIARWTSAYSAWRAISGGAQSERSSTPISRLTDRSDQFTGERDDSVEEDLSAGVRETMRAAVEQNGVLEAAGLVPDVNVAPSDQPNLPVALPENLAFHDGEVVRTLEMQEVDMARRHNEIYDGRSVSMEAHADELTDTREPSTCWPSIWDSSFRQLHGYENAFFTREDYSQDLENEDWTTNDAQDTEDDDTPPPPLQDCSGEGNVGEEKTSDEATYVNDDSAEPTTGADEDEPPSGMETMD